MFVRRRPLLRAAAIGGGAYMAGKARQRNQADREAAEADQDARISNIEQQQSGSQQQAPPPAAAPAPGGGVSDQLKQLAALHEQGALTDEEFAAAKSKLLGL
jgi:putative oligomerization/nucleic acid binding protein